MGLWVRVVREDFWGAVEDDVMIVLVGTMEGRLGVKEVTTVSGASEGLEERLEGVCECAGPS